MNLDDIFPVSLTTTLEGAGPNSTYQSQFQNSASLILGKLETKGKDIAASEPLSTTSQQSAETTTLALPGNVPSRTTSLAGMKRKADDAAEVQHPFNPSSQTIALPPSQRAPPLAVSESKPLDRSAMTPRELEIDTLRRRNLAMLPSGIIPARPDLLGFRGGHSSDSARSSYFSARNRTDLLNILGFADQLHPHLLVDIMVSVSKKHPELPVFATPDWDPAAAAENKVLSLASSASRRRHGHTLINPRMRHRHKAAKKSKLLLLEKAIAKRANSSNTNNDGGSESPAVEEDEDTLPDIWPRAGDGLYAKLPVETDDDAYMVDDNEDEAFSHFMVDRTGKLTAISACG